MSELSFFKPNKSNSGFHFKFNVNPSKNGDEFCDLAIYIQATRQARWDTNTNQGSFKENFNNPEKSISVKMNLTEMMEVSSLIDRIKSFSPISAKYIEGTVNNQKCSFYRANFFHQWDGGNTVIKVSPVTVDTAKGEIFPNGVFFSISKDGTNRYTIRLTWGELGELQALLRWAMDRQFIRKAKFLAKVQQKGDATRRNTPPPQHMEETVSSENDNPNPFI